MSDLKPCPFCGGAAELHYDYSSEIGDWYVIDCLNNGCMISERGEWGGQKVSTGWRKSESEATEAWNTRSERTCHWVYFEDSVSTPDFHEDDWHLECSECGFDPESIIGPNVDDPELLSCFVHCPSCGAKVIS